MKRLRDILATLKGMRLKAVLLMGTTLLAGRALGANPATLDIWVQVSNPVTLDAQLAVSATTISLGQVFTAWMTATNTGAGTGNNLTAQAWKASGAANFVVVTGPTPPVAPLLGPASTVVFDWTLLGAAAGSFTLSGSVTTDSGTASNKPVSPLITVQTPPVLNASLKVHSSSLCTGQNFVVTLTVTNTGQATALGVIGSMPLASGTGNAAWVDGPYPTAPVNLGLNQAVTFTYTFTGSAPGTVLLTTTATGTDANSGVAVSSGPKDSGSITFNMAGTLVAGVTVPGTVSTNQNFNVVLTLTNPAGSDITGVVPSLAQSPPGFATYISGPVPASVALMPGAGAPRTFTWVYKAPGAVGTADFTLTGTGSVCGGTDNALAGATGTVNVVTSANLEGIVHAFPSAIVEPQAFMVTLTLTNTGGTTALSVTPFLAVTGATTAVALSGGPNPAAGTVSILPGASAVFTWTYTGVLKPATSVVGFNSAGTKAMDANSLAPAPVLNVAGASVTVYTHSALTASLTLNPAGIPRLSLVVASMQVNNTGSADASITSLTHGFWDNKGGTVLNLFDGPTPATPATVPGNSSLIFTWTYSGDVCGFATVYADASGVEIATATALTTGQKISNKVNVYGTPTSMVAVVDRNSEKVGGIANMTFQLVDDCLPDPIPVKNAVVNIVVISGGGYPSPATGVTDSSGKVKSMLHVGRTPGINAVRGDSGTVPGATVYVTGTLPSVPEPYLTKNFFNPKKGEKVQVRVAVPEAMKLNVMVFSQAGDLVRRLKEAEVPAGMNVLEWDGRNDSNAYVGNGVYMIQIITGSTVQTKRVIVIKL